MIIYQPASFQQERQYILHVMLGEFLGLEYQSIYEQRNNICITMQDNNAKKLIISDAFFNNAMGHWLKRDSLPKQPLAVWRVENKEIRDVLTENQLPVIYGEADQFGNYLFEVDNEVRLGIDVFGAAFFMLTRYEEVVKQENDEHGRFLATASLAYQEDFLKRPIINEYLEIVWWCIKRLWPAMERKQRNFKMVVTHDVDYPFAYAFTSWQRTCRSAVADLVKRHELLQPINRLIQTWRVKAGQFYRDENYTFSAIMDISEAHNLKSCFYFMTEQLNSKYDTFYPFKHPYIKGLLKEIHSRGHEIGIHPSYISYYDGHQIRQQFLRLREACQSLGIFQERFGGRQHYLRWSPETWQHYYDAGLYYDSSLSYADKMGFRCGVCFSYPVYNLTTREALRLYEQPLLVTDFTALEPKYMGLSCEQTKEIMKGIQEIVHKYNGEFVLLWHNNRLTSAKYLETYKSVFEA